MKQWTNILDKDSAKWCTLWSKRKSSENPKFFLETHHCQCWLCHCCSKVLPRTFIFFHLNQPQTANYRQCSSQKNFLCAKVTGNWSKSDRCLQWKKYGEKGGGGGGGPARSLFRSTATLLGIFLRKKEKNFFLCRLAWENTGNNRRWQWWWW